MNGKERVLAVLAHKEPDRVPIYDALMMPTLMNWYSQGLDMDENPTDVFDHDISIFFSDCTPQFEYEVIKEDDEYLTIKDIFGQHAKSSKTEMTIMPQVMDVAVKNKKDWNSFKDRLVVNDLRLEGFKIVWNNFPGGRLSKKETLADLNKHHNSGRFNLLFMITGYDVIQMYLGSERLLMDLVEDPSWCKEMFDYNCKIRSKPNQPMFVMQNKKQVGVIHPETGKLTLTLETGKILAKHKKYYVSFEGKELEGSTLFAIGVIDADPQIRPSDSVIILNEERRLIAVGNAIISGKDMKETKRGPAVKIKQKI